MNDLIELYAPAYHDGIIAAVILIGVIFVSLLLQRALFAFLERLVGNKNDGIFGAMLRRSQKPSGFALPLLGALIAIPYLTFPERVDTVLLRVVAVATTI